MFSGFSPTRLPGTSRKTAWERGWVRIEGLVAFSSFLNVNTPVTLISHLKLAGVFHEVVNTESLDLILVIRLP